jgi:hypothetical protein
MAKFSNVKGMNPSIDSLSRDYNIKYSPQSLPKTAAMFLLHLSEQEVHFNTINAQEQQ